MQNEQANRKKGKIEFFYLFSRVCYWKLGKIEKQQKKINKKVVKQQ